MESFDFTVVDSGIRELGSDPGSIIGILQMVQEHCHYLPRDMFFYLAKKLNVPVSRIYGVATFYENFSLEPKGKYVIKICDGTACHVRKSMPVLERLRGELGLTETQRNTSDLLFTVETVSCLGACGLAPVLMINDKVYPAMTPDKASAMLAELKNREESSNVA